MPNPRAYVNESVFDDLTQEAAAYWAGFIMADGCVLTPNRKTQKQVSLKLGGRDVSHLEKWRAFIGSPLAIRETNNGTRSLIVSSDRLADRLSSLNVIPRKTGREEAPVVLVNNKHFWRGVVDGDGHLGFHPDRREYKGKVYEYRRATFNLYTSKRLIEQFLLFLEIPLLISAKGRCHFVQTQKKAVLKKICRTLYSRCSVYLPRKRAVALEVINASY